MNILGEELRPPYYASETDVLIPKCVGHYYHPQEIGIGNYNFHYLDLIGHIADGLRLTQ